MAYLIIITKNFEKELAMAQIFQCKQDIKGAIVYISTKALIFYARKKTKQEYIMAPQNCNIL